MGAFFYKIRQYILEDYEAKVGREGGREGGRKRRGEGERRSRRLKAANNLIPSLPPSLPLSLPPAAIGLYLPDGRRAVDPHQHNTVPLAVCDGCKSIEIEGLEGGREGGREEVCESHTSS